MWARTCFVAGRADDLTRPAPLALNTSVSPCFRYAPTLPRLHQRHRRASGAVTDSGGPSCVFHIDLDGVHALRYRVEGEQPKDGQRPSIF